MCISRRLVCFESSQIALANGSYNFENFQNITCAHKTFTKCTRVHTISYTYF